MPVIQTHRTTTAAPSTAMVRAPPPVTTAISAGRDSPSSAARRVPQLIEQELLIGEDHRIGGLHRAVCQVPHNFGGSPAQ
jgi:hypothetical protein